MRDKKGAEKKRFRWILENILFPFINWARMECDKFNAASGACMGKELPALSWYDGDKSQLDSIVSGEC